MKKIKILLLLFILSEALFGQNSKITTAFNSLIEFKSEKNVELLEKARIAIDSASVNEKTSTKAKTWFCRGYVYYVIDTVNKKNPNFPVDALEIAFKAFVKSYELDSKFDVSFIDQTYTILLNPLITAQNGLDFIRNRYIQKSIKDFEIQDFKAAYSHFEKAIIIDEKLNLKDTLVWYYTAVAAENAKMYTEAKNYYYKILNLNLNKNNYTNLKSDYYKVYSSLASILIKTDKDTLKAIEILKKGREAFPENSMIIFDEINFYLGINKLNEVKNIIDYAITTQPTNSFLYNIKGYLFNNTLNNEYYMKNKEAFLNNFNEAEKLYKKSAELDAKFFDPNYNLGLLYISKANAILNYASSLVVNDPRYKEEINKGLDVLKLAIEPLIKASEINPKDKDPLTALKQVYYRLNLKDKMDDIQQKINNL